MPNSRERYAVHPEYWPKLGRPLAGWIIRDEETGRHVRDHFDPEDEAEARRVCAEMNAEDSDA